MYILNSVFIPYKIDVKRFKSEYVATMQFTLGRRTNLDDVTVPIHHALDLLLLE